MRIGYARVSTDDQKLDLQMQALDRAGCDRVFIDRGLSGGLAERPGLEEMIASLQPRDTLVVWRLDRLGRSLVNLIQLMEELGRQGVHFHSLTENIDTTSSGGRLVFHMMAALAEFERGLISERTRAGMAAAKSNGQRIGRPPSLEGERLQAAIQAVNENGEAINKVAKRFDISPRSLRRMLQAAKELTA
ncbi:recombinase family protein [Agrobacterium rhizogenes]|nr:recombinase family protein [Rhizobium rhizogenes]NTH66586.1 recombinase family protein [Rhizobium rhizogenes]